MSQGWKSFLGTISGYFLDRILRKVLPALGFSPVMTNVLIFGLLAILCIWILRNYFLHKDDVERQEVKFEQAFEKALQERAAHTGKVTEKK
jgi:ABC-type branched-subunit amino acid transport system permease subunit